MAESFNDSRRRLKIVYDAKRLKTIGQNPSLAKLQNERNGYWLSLMRGDIDEASAASQAEKAEVRLAEAFLACDMPVDYVPECPKCGDSGTVGGKPCECRIEYEAELEPELTQEKWKGTFETFNEKLFSNEPLEVANALPNANVKKAAATKDQKEKQSPSPRENMRENRKKALEFTRNFPASASDLFFMGPCGTGKTFLAECIANRLQENGHSVCFITEYNFVKTMGRTELDYENPDRCRFFECDLLILDDLGTKSQTDYASACLYTLLSERAASGLPTIITTNLSLLEIHETYSPRIFSRLVGQLKACKFIGTDVRVSMRK